MTQPQIPKYVPKRKIRSVGAYYTVYEATQSGLNRPVELRVLNHEVKEDSPEFKRFQNEFKTLAALDHPNIVNVFDLGMVRRHVFYVTDYRNSDSLKSLLADKKFKFSMRDLVVVFRGLASALNHLHHRQVIHRAISLDSVYLDRDTKTSYIAEFSMVKNFNLDNLTSAGIPQMVEYLRTPEFAKGLDTDERVDLYLLGELMFKLLTHRKIENPRDRSRGTDEEKDEKRHPRYFNSNVPPELDEVVYRCLRPDREERYATAGELLEAVEEAEQKIRAKSVLSKIAETSQDEVMNRTLERRQKELADARERMDTARFETLHQKEKQEVARRTRRYGAPEALSPLQNWWKAHRYTVQLLTVPVIVFGMLGYTVLERQELMEEQERSRTKATKAVYTVDPESRFDDEVREMVTKIKTTSTTNENFSDRWYLLSNWILQILREKKKPPFTNSDLIEVRKNLYQDRALAARNLEELYIKAEDYLLDQDR